MLPVAISFDTEAQELAWAGSGSNLYAFDAGAIYGSPSSPLNGSFYVFARAIEGWEQFSSGSHMDVVRTNVPTQFSGNWPQGIENTRGLADARTLVAEMLDRIRSKLQVNMSELAQLLGLQRPSLYKWYEGRQPHAGNRERLSRLEQFAEIWSQSNLPGLRLFLSRAIPGDKQTLAELLSADPLDLTSLRKAVDAFRGQESNIIKRLPQRPNSLERRRRSLDELAPPVSFDWE